MCHDISNKIKHIAKMFKVTVCRDIENCDNNTAFCAGNEIFIGKFDDSEIELAAFFHELGHYVMVSTVLCGRPHTMSKLSCEGTAWEVGFSIAHQYGYTWGYDHKVMKWARKQFSSYWNSEYNDLLVE